MKRRIGMLAGILLAAAVPLTAYGEQWMKSPDGSWYCFADDPKTGPEATGTTGIAAAFALAAESGFADSSYAARAQKAFDWFVSPENIEPDGLAKNATQSNRIGDAFQRSGYRVIMQISSGFAAQIMAVKMRSGSLRA